MDGKTIGTTGAKPEGETLAGVEEQSTEYVSGVPFGLPAWKSPLPFCYESTGAETLFTLRDHSATVASIDAEDFDFAPFLQRGGLGKAHELFGEQVGNLLEELNQQLVA